MNLKLRENKTMRMNNNKIAIMVSTILLVLLVPLIVMQFTDEVNWSLFDFVLAAILLFGAGLIGYFVMRKVGHSKFRLVLYIILLAVLLLIWAELAVGIFGTPFGGD